MDWILSPSSHPWQDWGQSLVDHSMEREPYTLGFALLCVSHLPLFYPWTNRLTSLRLSFLICKMGSVSYGVVVKFKCTYIWKKLLCWLQNALKPLVIREKLTLVKTHVPLFMTFVLQPRETSSLTWGMKPSRWGWNCQ